MRKLRYNVAVSMDGFIADPSGGYAWIVMDDTIDFTALLSEFDTLLMGRKTFDVLRAQGPDGPAAGKKIVVVSRTLRPDENPGITILWDEVAPQVAAMKAVPGKDIWLFGGGELFRLLLDADLVDTVELAVMPVMLGEGIPVLPPGKKPGPLHLVSSRSLPTGIVMLAYETRKPP